MASSLITTPQRKTELIMPTTPKAPKRQRVRRYIPFSYDTFDEMDSEEERNMADAAERMTRRRQEDASPSVNWPIHRGYLIYSLEDVACENNRETLEKWLDLFSPATQPRSEEEHFYVRLMSTAISDKLDCLSN